MFLSVDLNRRMTNPFPGRFPTRWDIMVVENKHYLFRYIGKPDATVALKVKRMGKVPGRTFGLCEFDKDGSIRTMYKTNPREGFKPQTIHPVLNYIYYPFDTDFGAYFFGPWGHRPVFHKRILLDRRAFSIYAPIETMVGQAIQVERLREYKIWLRKSNLLK